MCELELGVRKTFLLLTNERVYLMLSTCLLPFAQAPQRWERCPLVGDAIAWKTNVMTTAIMQIHQPGYCWISARNAAHAYYR